MKKTIFLSIFLGILCAFSNNTLFSMNGMDSTGFTNQSESDESHEDEHRESIPDIFDETNDPIKFRQAKARSIHYNFVANRLSKKFDLQKICQKHSVNAIDIYRQAIENFLGPKGILPLEVREMVNYFRDFSFWHPFKNNSGVAVLSLFALCAQKVATLDIDLLPSNISTLIHALRSILFHAKANECYDPKLAKLLIRIHLDDDYTLQQSQLDKCLCTAAYLGDAFAVKLLLQKGADCNFVNYYDDFKTPLAYALIQEHNYSKIKSPQKPNSMRTLIIDYERIAEMLIKSGAKIDHRIRNGASNNERNITYLFMQTSNLKIFDLMEGQLADKAELTDTLGCTIAINAFKLGNANFIKKLCTTPLYRDSLLAITGNEPLMYLAFKYYKGYDFNELFKFLDENDKEQTSGNKNTARSFGFVCLNNAIKQFDYECIKSLSLSGIGLNNIYPPDNITLLIYVIKYYNPIQHNKKNLIKIIELLLYSGVDLYHEDSAGKTALDYASERNLSGDIIEALINMPLIYAIRTCNPKKHLALIGLINELRMKHGIGMFNYRDFAGKNVLDYAIEYRLHQDVIDTLTKSLLIEIIKLSPHDKEQNLAKFIELSAAYGYSIHIEEEIPKISLYSVEDPDLAHAATDALLNIKKLK